MSFQSTFLKILVGIGANASIVGKGYHTLQKNKQWYEKQTEEKKAEIRKTCSLQYHGSTQDAFAAMEERTDTIARQGTLHSVRKP